MWSFICLEISFFFHSLFSKVKQPIFYHLSFLIFIFMYDGCHFPISISYASNRNIDLILSHYYTYIAVINIYDPGGCLWIRPIDHCWWNINIYFAKSSDLFHKQFMSSLLKSCENPFCSNFDSNDPIRSQFCTRHDSLAVMACAKLLPD